MIRQLAAFAVATTLLATAVPAVQATAAPTGVTEQPFCLKLLLDLPAGAATNASGKVETADPSGRYVLGSAQHEGRAMYQAVLWVDGAPRWLATQPGSESAAYSVAEGGFVLGTSVTRARTDYWIYSISTDSYRMLRLPKNLQVRQLVRMNNRQDILGIAWDQTLERQVPFVWPAGRQPRLLPLPKGQALLSLDDISDEGRVVGQLVRPGTADHTSYLWKSWGTQPTRLRGLHHDTVFARDLEGTMIAGEESSGARPTGLIWNTENTDVVEVEDSVADLNSSGDAVTTGSDFPDSYPSILRRSDGSRITFPDGIMLDHIFERTVVFTAGGYDVSTGIQRPLLYDCDN